MRYGYGTGPGAREEQVIRRDPGQKLNVTYGDHCFRMWDFGLHYYVRLQRKVWMAEQLKISDYEREIFRRGILRPNVSIAVIIFR